MAYSNKVYGICPMQMFAPSNQIQILNHSISPNLAPFYVLILNPVDDLSVKWGHNFLRPFIDYRWCLKWVVVLLKPVKNP